MGLENEGDGIKDHLVVPSVRFGRGLRDAMGMHDGLWSGRPVLQD